jgi:hypothetical protein
MKKKFFGLSLIAISLPFFAHAELAYTFLAPIPGFEDVPPGSPLLAYLVNFIELMIGVAGVIGVVQLVLCGFSLLTAPGESQRSHAKECILKVVIGLLIALSGYVLLQTINPILNEARLPLPETGDVLAGSRDLPTVPGWYYAYRARRTGNEVFSGTLADQPACQAAEADRRAQGVEITRTCFQVRAVAQGNDFCPNGEPSAEFSEANEGAARQQICGNTSCVGSTPIGINARYCVDTCAVGCTNVQGLPGGAIAEIRRVQQACACNVRITGGTEYHLHVSHAANRPIFDLGKNSRLDNLLRQGQSAPSFGGYTKYLNNGFWYTDEGNHWHVCQAGTNGSAACN